MYTGIAELQLSDENLAKLYEGSYKPDLFINQYIILKNEVGEIIDKGRWTEDGYSKLKYKTINNDYFGKFRPKNIEQEFAFDALQNEKITGILLQGGFGSGKSMCSLVHAIDLLINNRSKISKIVFLRNNIPTKNTIDVGALPNDLTSKIKPFAMMLADILGDETQLDRLIGDGKVYLEHIGFIRGRSFKNSIVYVSEAQNLTQEQISIIISRIGENSRLFIEGDLSQWDRCVFQKESGIVAMGESLKGDSEFAMITLYKNERSRFASLSDKVLSYKQ